MSDHECDYKTRARTIYSQEVERDDVRSRDEKEPPYVR